MQRLTEADPERLRRLVAGGEFFWLDLVRPSPAEVGQLPELVGLDPEAAARALRFGAVPQIRRFQRHVGLVIFGAEPRDHGFAELVEVHVFVSGEWVVTVREQELAALREFADEVGHGPEPTEADVVAGILQAPADSFAELMDQTDEVLERIERSAADAQDTGTPAPLLRREILERRDGLFRVRRTVRRQRDYIERAVEDLSELPGLERSQHHRLRDVAGQMIRVSDQIDDGLDRLASALDLLNSTLANRLNVITERLTLIATIFLPLTVVTGFFGQNFGWMVERIDSFAAFLILGIGLFAMSGIATYAWVRRLEQQVEE